MKYFFCIFFTFFLPLNSFSIGDYKSGQKAQVAVLKLKLRNERKTGLVIDTLSLAAEIIFQESKNFENSENIDGIEGHWVKVKYKDVTGFVFDGFLTSLPVPKLNETSEIYIKNYFSSKYSNTSTYGNCSEIDSEGCKKIKETFGIKNQNSVHFFNEIGYEYFTETISFSNTTLEEVYLLSKILYATVYKDLKDQYTLNPNFSKESEYINKMKPEDMKNVVEFSPNANGEIILEGEIGCYGMIMISSIGGLFILNFEGGC